MVSGEKRNCEDGGALEKINAILLDIEGTTTAISFVKETLFPYVKENLKTHIESNWNDDEFKADLKALKAQAKIDEENKVDNFCPIEEGDNEKESVMKNVLWQMDADRKTTALKQLQGHIWRKGYESGKLKGHLFSDVAQMLKKWCEQDRKLYIFSSGSVESQKLLFKHSESGDLQGFISGYFDTETGPKTETSSYSSIAKAIGHDCSQILFLTDVIKEAVAADKAGMQVMVIVREGNTPLAEDEKKAFPTASSFEDVILESSNKKKKICEEESVQPETGKTENVSATENSEPSKTENGDSEKMEVETTETISESKAEEKTETTESPEADTENVEVDVDDSTVAKESEEKLVSSSNTSSGVVENEGKETSTANGATETTTVEEPEQEKETKEEEKVDSTEEAATAAKENDSKPEAEKEVRESSEPVEDKTSNEKSVNGHEAAEEKEVKAETNGKLAEETEAETITVKKVTAEEQADSTVEVTA